MALGDNIRSLRERRGWTTHRLAEASGMQQSSISRIEAGKVRPRPAGLIRIADALNTDPRQLEYGNANFEIIPLGTRKIPILDYSQVVVWTRANSAYREGEMSAFILTNENYSKKAFAMVIKGDSMLPDFREGDIIVVDPTISPNPGDFVIAIDPLGDAVFKRYKAVGLNGAGQDVFELRPLNDLYPTLRSDLTPVEIIGTMVETTRKFRTQKILK